MKSTMTRPAIRYVVPSQHTVLLCTPLFLQSLRIKVAKLQILTKYPRCNYYFDRVMVLKNINWKFRAIVLKNLES